MVAIVVILVVTAIVAGLITLLGGGLLALIVVPIGIAVAVWMGLAGSSGTRTKDVASREPPQGDLLGPGGQDDPTS